MKKKTEIGMILCLMACILLSGCGKNEEDKMTDLLKDKVEAAKEKEEKNKAIEIEEEDETEPEEEEEEAKPADLKDILISEIGDESLIQSFEKKDFDGDGTEEAFAVTGEVMDDFDGTKVIEGKIWFVSEDGCEVLHPTEGMGVYDSPRFMTMGRTEYILFDEMYATALVTYVFRVVDGEAEEMPFSALGEVVTDTPDGEGRFRILHDSYDVMFNPETESWLGHTWKYYYFFHNSETDRVEEFGGTEINEETVEYLCGKDLVQELIPEMDILDEIFCRGNGLIVINFEHAADGCANYRHYIYNFLDKHFVDDLGEETNGDEPLDGYCKDALCPEIANYPTVPGPQDAF